MDKPLTIKALDMDLKPVQGVENTPEQKYVIPLDGKWIPAESAIHIGKNYSTLTNMRYRNNHPETILGATLITSAAMHATYLKARSGFHFVKDTPAESHILVQAYNTGQTASVVLDNKTAVPSAGNFVATPLWTDSTGAGIGQFSYAPGGHMVYCNGVDCCIWGGAEVQCEAFVTSSAAIPDTGVVTNPRNYTDVIKNTQSDAANSAVIGGGNDSYTVLMLHGEGSIADSSIGGGGAPPKTVTASGGCATTTAQAKFGTGSILFDGTKDFVYVDSTDADINDFYMGTGAFTIDFWIRLADPTADAGIFQQYVDGTSYVDCVYTYAPAASTIMFNVVDAGGNVNLETVLVPVLTANKWYHIAVIRGWGGVANAWAITIDGVRMTDDKTDTSPWPDLNADFDIGRAQGTVSGYLSGWIDEFRVSKGIARWTADFSPRSKPYSDSVSRVFAIGSRRPLQGAKIYVIDANQDTSTLAGRVRTQSGWAALTLTDGTTVGGKSLAQTGSITFSSTVDTAKPIYMEGNYLYWYEFTLSAGEAMIYHVTLDAPFQNIMDLWDGLYRQLAAAYLYSAVRVDNTTQVRTTNFLSSDQSTFMILNSLAVFSEPNYCIEAGFTEKQTALSITMGGEWVNTNAADMSIDYWDGENYVSVGAIADGTKVGTKSLAVSGVVSWSNNSLSAETPKVIADKSPFYYYRIRFSAQLSATVTIDLICGIPAAVTVKGYSFGINAAGRLMLGCDNYEKKNTLLISASNAPQTLNGDDSYEIPFGGDKALTCGTAIFAQYASNLFNLALVFKEDETWTLTWTTVDDETQWERYQIAPNIGCPAPRTLKTVAVELDKNIAQVKTIGIWRGNAGIYMSNGQTPLCVSDDIENVFDQNKTPHVNLSMTTKEVGFYDGNKTEYHWLWASGSSTALDKEYVLDMKRWRWFEIDRTSGMRLQLGIDVVDTNGGQYSYGTDDSGNMLRLEYGTSFNGAAIVSTMAFGYQLLTQSDTLSDNEVLRAAVTAMAKNTDSAFTLTHTMDGGTGVAYTMSLADATHSFTTVVQDIGSTPGIFHTFQLVHSSATENKGLEPLFFSLYYEKVRDRKH